MAYPNPTHGSQTWLSEQPLASYSIPNVFQPIDENPLPVATSNPPQTINRSNSHLRSNALKRKLKLSQNVRCEICDIYCNSLEVYEKHLSGKKHLKSLKKNYPPHTTPSQPTPQSVVNSSMPENVLTTCNVPCDINKPSMDHVSGHKDGDQMCLKEISIIGDGMKESSSITMVSGHYVEESSSRPVDEGLDKKRKLTESRIVEESVSLSNTGNAACGSDVISADHLAGEKHNIQTCSKEIPITHDGMEESSSITTVSGHHMEEPSSRSIDEGLDKKQNLMENKIVEESVLLSSTEIAANRTDVTSFDHLAGNKHNLQEATTSTEILSLSTGENLGTKKQMLIQCGVAGSSVHVCTTCNVVCNSEIVFADHIQGKRHIAQAQKSSTRSTSVRKCDLCKVVCNSDFAFNSHLTGQKHASMLKKIAQTAVVQSAAHVPQ